MLSPAASRLRFNAKTAARAKSPEVAGALFGFAFLAPLAFADGGYWPPAWGWSAVAALWLGALALVLSRRLRLRALDVAFLATLGALVGWILASALWTEVLEEPMLESQRALMYLACAGAALLVLRAGASRGLLAGVWASIVLACTYGLATRLFPERLGVFDPIAGYRLSEPLGYWNALGIVSAAGALLAVGFAARGRRPLVRAAGASSLLVLIPTLYFTFSRGAWIALGLGLLAAIALDPRRVQLVTASVLVAPWPAAAVFLASRSDALTNSTADLASASRDGHRLALALMLLAVLAALAILALTVAERRFHPPRPVRLAYSGALALAALAALTAVFALYGSPATIARNAHDAFLVAEPPSSNDLNERLFTLSGNGRPLLWSAAWDEYVAHSALGAGAGSFERTWLRERPASAPARDAHSLYVETLSELGPLGLGLLAAALAIPLIAAARARTKAVVPAAFGAYVAYLAHAGIDWDWEMPAATLTALFCAVALLRARRRDAHSGEPGMTRWPRAAGLVVVGALTAFALVGLLANSAVSAAEDAARDGRWREAERQALRAAEWAPWSAEAWRLAGEAQLAQARPQDARGSFREGIERDELDWHLWLDLALASDGAARQRAKAEALRLNPLSPDHIGEVFRSLSRKSRAKTPPGEEASS